MSISAWLFQLLNVFGGLAIVLIFIVAGSRWLKRYQSGSVASGRVLQILGAVSLGSRERLVLVKSKDREILVGVSSAGISAIYVGESAGGERSDTAALTDSSPTAPLSTASAKLHLKGVKHG